MARAGTVLDRIADHHRQRAARDERRFAELLEQTASLPPTRPFRDGLAESASLAVIAEVKRRSPSRGDLAPHLDPGSLAAAYADGGASALSVLTDAFYFGGSPEDLRLARSSCSLPVLRKDFTVDRRDLCDARLMGADAVLLIVGVLSDAQLASFLALAAELDLAALVEAHDERELDRALAAGADLVGVNQRDLHTFEVDPSRAERLRPRIPAGVVTVAESGVRDRADASRLADAGYDAILVGESLLTTPDPARALRQLLPMSGKGTGA